MSEWAAKRFWTDVAVVPEDGGFGLRLDGRMVKTPAKAPLRVPTSALAEAVAREWRAVEDVVVPAAMPFTRAVNAAIDKVAPQGDAVRAELLAYGASDLLCYRAAEPQGLVERQAAGWDPLLDWAETALGARLVATTGVMPRVQDPAALEALASALRGADPFALTALSEMVSLSGSLVVGLAAVSGAWDAADLWERSRIDEAWQEEVWGRDEEAAEVSAARRAAFLGARTLHSLAAGR